MRFASVKFDGILELHGEMEFPLDKMVVLYGANQQGKTNIINAIRYAFLKEEERGKGSKKEYNDWALPKSKELVSDENGAEITIEFEHDNNYYRLQRKLDENGEDAPTLYRLERGPGSNGEAVELETFLKDRLRVGLLNALFAPEIAGGFKHLYGKNMDESIRMMFREVSSARDISRRFIIRMENLRTAADAESARIRKEYEDLIIKLRDLSKDSVTAFPEFHVLEPYKPGSTYDELTALSTAIKGRVQQLEAGEFFKYLEDMRNKANSIENLRKRIQDSEKIIDALKEIRWVKADITQLRKVATRLTKIREIEDRVQVNIPVLNDEKLNEKIRKLYDDLVAAKSLFEETRRTARREGLTNLETIGDKMKEIKSVVRALSGRRKISIEKPATVTKIGDQAYTVLPAKALIDDPALTNLSRQPLPKGSKEELDLHSKELKTKYSLLAKLENDRKKAKDSFRSTRNKIDGIGQIIEKLSEKSEELKDSVKDWTKNVCNEFSAFSGEKFEEIRALRNASDVSKLSAALTERIDQKAQEFFAIVNNRLAPLTRSISSFSEDNMKIVIDLLKQEKADIPAYQKTMETLDSEKTNWRENDEAVIDYAAIPTMVEQSIQIFNLILEKSIDEEVLKKAIATTFQDNINMMKERKLIEATPILQPGRGLQTHVIKYKDKNITHPAGSEKAFFTLAILTSLGEYFGMPILIDEVANNLDQHNLPNFFNLAARFKQLKGIQYLLSIKETRDFDLEGWVKELDNDIVIYELKEKQIQKRILD